MLNMEQSNLVFLKTCNTEFDKIIMTLTNKNDRPLGIGERRRYSIEQKKENMSKDIDFCHSQEIYLTNAEKDTAI